MKSVCQKDTCAPRFTAVPSRIVNKWEQPKCSSTNQWICIHDSILLSHKKGKIPLFVSTWMGLEIIILSETSQAQKDRYYMPSLISRI
jgi:hypothetical protein